jgi:hypothetical protein
MHWKGGFRHEIDIPDGIFPRQWRDLEQTEEEEHESGTNEYREEEEDQEIDGDEEVQ